jgi:hypothetical protein
MLQEMSLMILNDVSRDSGALKEKELTHLLSRHLIHFI